MKKIIAFVTHRQFLIFLGLVFLSILIYWLAPDLAAAPGNTVPEGEESGDEFRPFLTGRTWRLVLIACLFGIWLLIHFISFARTLIAASKLKENLAPPEPTQAARQIGALENEFGKAVEALESDKGSKGKRSLVELPWYMVLGPSGVGKTELLRTSGLEFPYEGDTQKKYLSGAGGTLNCKWWLTREAILLDTAGRYVLQDQNREADGAEWNRFLELLRRHRKRQPLNGIIAVISADDVLQDYRTNSEALRSEALRLRQRIQELQRSFGMRLPVYLVLAKCDLIAGFTEYFRDLNSVDRRSQALGFDVDDEVRDSQTFIGDVSAGFHDMVGRLRQRTLTRLHDEHNAHRKAQIQSFPKQIDNIMLPLLDFVDLAFGFDDVGDSCRLRGVYFSSATQVGAPIDQLTSELSEIFGVVETQQSDAGGEGRSYFVRDLLQQKVFPEKSLAGESKRWRALSGWSLKLAAGLGVAAILLSSALWLSGYSANKSALQEASQLLIKNEALIPAKADITDEAALLEYVDAIYDLRERMETRHSESRFAGFLGSARTSEILESTDQLYADTLNKYFVPYVATYPYEELKARLTSEDADTSFGSRSTDQFFLVKRLLILSQQKRLNTEEDKQDVLSWVSDYWGALYSQDQEHVDTLLKHLSYFDTHPMASVDYVDEMVDNAHSGLFFRDKKKLFSEMLRDDAFSDLNGAIDLRRSPNLSLFSAVFQYSGDGSALIIPELYTQPGFDTLIDTKYIGEFIAARKKDVWVLGDSYKMPGKKELERELQRLYTADYIRTWNDALKALSVKKVTGSYDSRAVVSTLVGTSSPLKQLLNTVAEQTNLAKPEAQGGVGNKRAASRIMRKIPGVRKAKMLGLGMSSEEEFDPRAVITEEFAELNSLSIGSEGSLPIVELLDQMASLLSPLGNAEADTVVFESVTALASRQPEPVKSWTSALVTSSSRVFDSMREQKVAQEQAQVRSDSEQSILSEYNDKIYSQCVQDLNGLFPVSPSAQEDISSDYLTQIFSPDGIMAQFSDETLSGYINRSRRPWRWEQVRDFGTLDLPDSLLESLEDAADIRRTYFPLPIKMTMEPGLVSPEITRLLILIDGQSFDYRQGAMLPVNINWLDKGGQKGVQITMTLKDGRDVNRTYEGEWGLYRALKEAGVSAGEGRGVLDVMFDLDGHRASIKLIVNRSRHPFLSDPLEGFTCPRL
ncbi:MAG: type VI secretion system membrane subunit TssM [Gammaproteobacteria bacterium]